MTQETRRPIRILKWISLGLFLGAFSLLIYDAKWGHFLFGKSFGPGAYYFTDVPGWQHVFLESPFLGFEHPILAGIFFIGWALLAYKVLVYLNDKL